MPIAQDIRGTVYKKGSAVFMSRIVGMDGSPLLTTDLNSVHYTVFQVDPFRPDVLTSVPSHGHISLTVSDVIFDTLQTGGLWAVDATGYNFLHQIDVSLAEAFSVAGANYQVRYELHPTVGQKIVFRFLLNTI